MAQKTNLNVNPYFDDFDSTKNFYKVLFNPGRPIQARELTTLQSILQNQIESFGSHIFKEGAMVIPGALTFDSQFYSVKINSSNFGVPVQLYLDQFLGKNIVGQTSGVTANLVYIAYPDGNEIQDVTLYVKYIDSDNDNVFNPFTAGEELFANENITYGNTTINAGTPFATVINDDPTSIGSAVSVDNGIYFIRGNFVRVEKETILLDPYENLPTYRIGFIVNEEIITAKDDQSLYDNAKGFNNFAAPGADRFKISVRLSKKSIDDLNDTDFIELMRVQEGQIKKITEQTQYSIIRDYLAKRTYDESGDYAVDPYEVTVGNSLNNRLGNNGFFFENEKTEQGNTPSEDLLSIKISPGKAYVRGYDVESQGTTILDVEKPRDTQTNTSNISFEMGNRIRVNNFYGAPKQKAEVSLYRGRLDGSFAPTEELIGVARIYTYNLVDAAYNSPSTEWDVYLYDLLLYTTLTVSRSVTTNTTSFVRGKSSGATGFVVSGGTSTSITVRQITGQFIVNEEIIIDDNENNTRTLTAVLSYSTDEIKSLYQANSSGYPVGFAADTILNKTLPPGFTLGDNVSITSGGVITSPGRVFTNIKVDSIIRYQNPGLSTETYNRVSSVASSGLSITVSALSAAVNGVCVESLPASTINVPIFIGNAEITSPEKSSLYSILPSTNVASIDLNDSQLILSEQITSQSTNGSGVLTFDISATGISSAFFESFDEDRYSIHYSDGSQARITSDQFSTTGTTVTVNGLKTSETNVVVNVTAKKVNVQSKVKEYKRSELIYINKSKSVGSGITSNESLNDGLTYSPYFGTRVQDESICLNYPDVSRILAVYESYNTSNPVLDKLVFLSSANVDVSAIVGENIIGSTSGAIARVVQKLSSNTLSIIYLNSQRFQTNESVTFSESNISTNITDIILGEYIDLTNNFNLDKGQRDQYLDYSRINRNKTSTIPSKRLLVVFDRYQVPSNDNGDVFTVLSYDEERYLEDIPNVGSRQVRASDILDFRPRVSPFTSTSASPFDFSQRSFVDDPKYIIAPNESSVVSYSFYLGRVDRVYVDKFGTISLEKGVSSLNPEAPSKPKEVMNIATISLPPYLYNPSNALINLTDNRRYTMRDIGGLENRIQRLEETTALSLLELSTQSLQIQDAQGLNRFKTGFFVDDFDNGQLVNFGIAECEVSNSELKPITARNSFRCQLAPSIFRTDEEIDLSENYDLLDSNVKKTGRTVTLNYREVGWIEQPIATRVENVNPFHVVEYSGTLTLTPSSDTWIRTVQLPNQIITQTTSLVRTREETVIETRRVNLWQWIFLRWRWGWWGWPWFRRSRTFTTTSVESRDAGSFTTETESNDLIDTINEEFMRSRNVEFRASNLKPNTRYYQFLDGNSGVDFIPKLIEIAVDENLTTNGSSLAFIPGETVKGSINSAVSSAQASITFRVANQNHKTGPFNNPTSVYTINPYDRTQNLSPSYSTSSSILNVDTFSLAEETQGVFAGRIEVGMRLVGQTSGAVAYVKDIRLVSDNFGFVAGCFWIREPFDTPAPPVRISTGNKTYRLSSDSSDARNLFGSKLISSAETNFRSEGTVNFFLRTITRTITQVTEIVTTTTNLVIRRRDPLAQSFTVGRAISAPGQNDFQEDINGAFLTGVDLYFRKKDPGSSPLTVEVRTVQLGTPTLQILGIPAILTPDQVNVSEDATVPTRVTFESPIFLPPGEEYAIVLIAAESDQYEAWIAQMGEPSVNAASLPNADQARYTQQFAIGSLFKSQNGSIWTADQYQDLKFKLYKAEFTSTEGTAFFYNPTLNEANNFIEPLSSNPITTFSKELIVGITTATDPLVSSVLTPGRKVTTTGYGGGVIAGTGSSITTLSITGVGTNYVTDTSVDTYNITGRGSGLKLNITATDGAITGVSTVQPGNGYAVGDVVGIVTSSVSSNTGSGALFTVSEISGLDTLYLTNVQGNFTVGVAITYVTSSGTSVSLGSTLVRSSTEIGGRSTGRHFRVNHFYHGMYANNNKVSITGVKPNSAPVKLESPFSITDTSINVAVADTTNFARFEGIPVGANNPGYLLIEDEIVKYEGIGDGVITSITRGEDSTIPVNYSSGTLVYKYELDGVSLRRINKTHDASDYDIQADSYYIEVDRTANGVNRNTDGTIPNTPQLSFANGGTYGGLNVRGSKNIQFDSIQPLYTVITPAPVTSVSANIRTVSGTSISGSETSFQDLGFEPIQLNQMNKLSSTRIVCSKINEDTYLSALPRNKSFTTGITLSTTDKNISPQIILDQGSTEFMSSRINSPIVDYVNDSRVNQISGDPHIASYYSDIITISQPATSIKILATVYLPSGSDIRALYTLDPANVSGNDVRFSLFPGYDNLSVDTDGDGIPDNIINPSLNSGRPDVRVPISLRDEFREYQFTADNLTPFTNYAIKIVFSSTNQADAPKMRDIRILTVR
jgi:hypothetical protein